MYTVGWVFFLLFFPTAPVNVLVQGNVFLGTVFLSIVNYYYIKLFVYMLRVDYHTEET